MIPLTEEAVAAITKSCIDRLIEKGGDRHVRCRSREELILMAAGRRGAPGEMKTRIYYFSGTGNSLHIARELRKRLKGAVLAPMVNAEKNGNMAPEADALGFIFPIHCLGLPIVVGEFLKKISVRPASYLFAVASRECSSRVRDDMDRILSRQGKKIDSFFSVNMPETYLPMFEVDSADEAARKEAAVPAALDSIAAAVNAGETRREADPRELAMYLYYALRPAIMFICNKTRYFNLENKFFADDTCNGCGLCEKICLAGKIEINADRPAWNRRTKCLFCFACIHFCPARAIQIRHSKTTVRGRYHHPLVSAAEIAAQKRTGVSLEPDA